MLVKLKNGIAYKKKKRNKNKFEKDYYNIKQQVNVSPSSSTEFQ